jgi:hypothetical protein
MVARMLTFFAVVMFVGAPAPARAADDAKSTAPTFVFRIDSINNLVEDAKYLAELAGETHKVEEGLKAFESIKNEKEIGKAIDFTRPIGMYGKINADNPLDSAGVLLLPILEEKPFLTLLEKFQMTPEPEKGEDGVYTVQAPFPPIPVYFRFANKYAYITAQNKSGVAKENILDPAKVLALSKPATFSALFRFDQVPDSLKQMAIGLLETNIATEKEKEIKGETKVQAEIRKKMMDGAAKHLSHLIQDAAELGLSFNIDRKEGRLNGDMTFSGKPGSTLAKEIENVGKNQSLFGGLVSSKAAINFLLHPVIPEDIRQAIGPAVDEGFKEALAKEKDAAKREVAEKIFKAIEPSLKAAELDVAFSFRGPSKENHYTFLAAAKLKEGEKIEEALKELAKKAPEKDQAKIHFDADKSGDFKIHKFDVQGDMDEKARAILGKHPVYLAFRSDAVLVTGGARGLETIKEALVAESKATPTGLLEISMSHLAPLIRAQVGHNDSDELKNAISEIFRGDHDKIRITLEGGKAVNGSLQLDASVIKFLAMTGTTSGRTFGKVDGENKPSKKPKKEKEEDKQ